MNTQRYIQSMFFLLKNQVETDKLRHQINKYGFNYTPLLVIPEVLPTPRNRIS